MRSIQRSGRAEIETELTLYGNEIEGCPLQGTRRKRIVPLPSAAWSSLGFQLLLVAKPRRSKDFWLEDNKVVNGIIWDPPTLNSCPKVQFILSVKSLSGDVQLNSKYSVSELPQVHKTIGPILPSGVSAVVVVKVGSSKYPRRISRYPWNW